MPSTRSQPHRALTTQKTIVAAVMTFLIGLALMFIAHQSAEWGWYESMRTVMREAGALLTVTAALTLGWDLFGKRALLQEVLEATKLSHDITASGLKRIGTNWRKVATFEELLVGANRVDIFVTYSISWLGPLDPLREFAKRKGATLSVYLADPHDPKTVEVLAARFAMTPKELIRRIKEVVETYKSERIRGGASINIYYYPGDRTLALYRFDATGVITLFSQQSRRKGVDVPTLVCGIGGEIQQFVANEFTMIREKSRPDDARSIRSRSQPHIIDNDISEERSTKYRRLSRVACSVVTAGANPGRDRIVAVKLHAPEIGTTIMRAGTNHPEHLIALLEDASTLIIFHNATLELAFILADWNIVPENVGCISTASALLSSNTQMRLNGNIGEAALERPEESEDYQWPDPWLNAHKAVPKIDVIKRECKSVEDLPSHFDYLSELLYTANLSSMYIHSMSFIPTKVRLHAKAVSLHDDDRKISFYTND